MEDRIEKTKPFSRKRSRKPKGLDFVGWSSKNLIGFLESLGRDTTDKISEYDVTDIVRKYIRELTHPLKMNKKKKKTKVVACDEKLSLLFGCQKVNTAKLSDLVAKHYVENQEEDEEYNNYLYSSEEEEEEDDDKKQRVSLSEKVVEKRKGSVAAIVRDNVKLVYLRKSLVEELAKRSETFEGKVLGTFVRIKNPCQLVQVTGVKEWNPIDGHFLQVTNYCYYLKDVASSALSDDDFTQEECEELNQRMKNGSVKRLTVVDMEEKVRSLHEDVTKHWIARELVLLKRKTNQASEKGWKRVAQYLDRRELLSNPDEKSRLLLEVPEVIAEEPEPECVDDDAKEAEERELVVATDTPKVIAEELEPERVDDDVKVEDDFMETNTEASIEPPKLRDEEEDQPPPWAAAASADDKDVLEDVEEQPEDSITAQKDSIAQANPPVIIELSDDDDDAEEDSDNAAYLKKCDPEKKMWCYELPKGITNGPYSLADFKRWSEQEYFVDVPDFKVFMRGNSIESGVLLTKLLSHIRG